MKELKIIVTGILKSLSTTTTAVVPSTTHTFTIPSTTKTSTTPAPTTTTEPVPTSFQGNHIIQLWLPAATTYL